MEGIADKFADDETDAELKESAVLAKESRKDLEEMTIL